MPVRRLVPDRPLDLRLVLGPLIRGSGDPTLRLSRTTAIRASWMASGRATLRLSLRAGSVELEAWGDGAEEALERAPALLGLDDDDRGFDPGLHPVVAGLARRTPGLRLGRTGSVVEALVPAVLEQKITGQEAFRSYRRLVRALAIPAPGPTGTGAFQPVLWMPPRASDLAALRSWAFPGLGIEPRRGMLIRRLAMDASRLEAVAADSQAVGGGGARAGELARRLRAYPGIGPWTAAEVTLRALGDPDAVSIGDAHLPHVVAWNLAGEPRATDARMLELLAPWAGQRARVVRLIEIAGAAPPRFGPRMPTRDLLDLVARR